MDEKEKGLYGKYKVEKISNPEKKIDCIVLEFDDVIARTGIMAWAEDMAHHGYEVVLLNVMDKLEQYGYPSTVLGRYTYENLQLRKALKTAIEFIQNPPALPTGDKAWDQQDFIKHCKDNLKIDVIL